MSTRTINGLDVGSDNVSLVVGQKKRDESTIKIMGTAQVPCSGLRKGAVVDIKETVNAISEAKEIAEKNSGMSIEKVYISLGGEHVCALPSQGTVAVSRADGEVSKDDVRRAIEAAGAVSVPRNNEIIKVIPRSFSLDNQTKIKDPIGMSGVRLELDALILHGASSKIKNLLKCVNQAQLDVCETVIAPLADSYAVLNKKQRELGIVLLDIGADTTGLIVLEEGRILHLAVLPIGAGHITNDLAIGLRTSVDTAEQIKKQFGCAFLGVGDSNKKIDLSKIDPEEEKQIYQYQLTQIIEPRLNEIFSMVNKELAKINRQKLLPGGVVLVGGGAKMAGMVDLAKKKLELPAQLGIARQIEGISKQVKDLSFVTALGLVRLGFSQNESKPYKFSMNFDGVFSKVKTFLSKLAP